MVAARVYEMHRSEKAMSRVLTRIGATDTIKWVASIAQILGYGATAMGAMPLNLWFFLAGIIGWFIVGLRWNDRAIMLIHIVALGAMLVGLWVG